MEYRSKIELHNIDCMEYMKGCEDNAFDLAIVDPPYGIDVANMAYTQEVDNTCRQKNGSKLKVKKNKYKKNDWDKRTAGVDWINELQRVSKNQIVFGINYMNFHLSGGRIIWNKLTPEGVSFSDCEVAYCSFSDRVDNVFFRWSGMIQGIYCGKDVRRALVQQGNKQLNEVRIHPTQKPVKLYEWILNKYAKGGDKILDTHLGSGSIAIACDKLGFDLVGCELDKDYFDAAVKRLEPYRRQKTLF